MNKQLFPFLLLIILAVAIFFRFRNLNHPSWYLFDEDLYVYTAHLILKGEKKAFEWWHAPDTTLDSPSQYRPPAVEWLHPPLSKYVIANSIAIFDDRPWVWRLPSAIAGVSLVIAIGWLAQTLFDKKSISLLAMSLAAIENLLVVQSRLASADIFVALFTTAALGSFAKWQMKNWQWGLPLAGILAGLAMTSKWSGGLIILAMIVLLIIDYFKEQRSSSVKLSNPTDRYTATTKSGSASLNTKHNRHPKLISRSANSRSQLTLALSTLILIPLCVYLFTYIPALTFGHSLAHIIELHRQAWQYQITNRAAHPNSSPAYMWLLNQKPVWYYFDEVSGQSIKAQASTLIFWGSMISIIISTLTIGYSNKSWTKKSKQLPIFTKILGVSAKEKLALFTLLIGFLALWLPWLFVQRPTFYYHFLPCVPIIIVILSYWLTVILDLIRNLNTLLR